MRTGLRDPRNLGGTVTADFRLSFAGGLLALMCLVATSVIGDARSDGSPRLIAWGGGLLFLTLTVIAVRHATDELRRVLTPRIGAQSAGVLRLATSLVGFVVAGLITLGLWSVPVHQLLLGGALTGIILGIAAQQALGNIFAGLVLLLARPFSVGDGIHMHSGNLAGSLQGRVAAMGLSYVTLDTSDGPMSVPNNVMLGAGVIVRERSDKRAKAPLRAPTPSRAHSERAGSTQNSLPEGSA